MTMMFPLWTTTETDDDSSQLSFSSFSSLFLACLFLLYTTWRFFLCPYLESKRPFDGALPCPPHSHWLLGHVPYLAGDDIPGFLERMMLHHSNEYGLTGFYLLHRQALSVNNWRDARAILLAETERRPIWWVRRHGVQFLGRHGLGLLNGREWKRQRAAVTRSLHPHEFLQQELEGIVVDVAKTLTESLLLTRQQQSQSNNDDDNFDCLHQVDVAPLMSMITMDVFGRAALSYDFASCRALEKSPLATAFDYLGAEVSRRLSTPLGLAENLYWIPVQANVRHWRERALLRDFLQERIQERRRCWNADEKNKNNSQSVPPAAAAAAAANLKKRDLLQSLMEANTQKNPESKSSSSSQQKQDQDDDDNNDMTDEILSDVLMTLLFAGIDTVTITLSYALYLLAKHPDKEARCVDEIQQCVKKNNNNNNDNNNTTTTTPLSPLSYKDLVYCRGVITETLRLYPPGYMVQRNMSKPLKLPHSQFVVPGDGTNIFIPIWLLHRNEEAFERPLEFHPERWVQPRRKKEKNNNKKNKDTKNQDDEDDDEDAVVWEERDGAYNHDNKRSDNDDKNSGNSTIAAGNRNAFFAFTAGARSCAGTQYAMREAVLAMAQLLRDLKFTVEPGYEVTPVRVGIAQHPKEVRMNIEQREANVNN